MRNRYQKRVRTDATSTVIETNKAFAVIPNWQWSDSTDLRDFNKFVLYFNASTIVTVNLVEIVFAWSDDETTLPFTDEDFRQATDYNILLYKDGSYNPKDYQAVHTTYSGSLVSGRRYNFVLPVKGRFLRVGVRADNINGLYDLRIQRLVA